MAEEDWGEMATNQPTFSLFKNRNPEEEAKKDTVIDIVTYNRWSRAERRLYNRLKTENIIARIEEEKCNSIDDITSCLDQLTIIRQEDNDPGLDDLITKLETMKLKASKTEAIAAGKVNKKDM